MSERKQFRLGLVGFGEVGSALGKGLRGEGLEANVDVALLSAFESAEALDAYQNHPHHKEVSAQLGPLRELRSVLDYWAC